MTALGGLLFLVLVAVVFYYLRLHLAWRADVRRRRAEREREREQRGYRTYSLTDPERTTKLERGLGVKP